MLAFISTTVLPENQTDCAIVAHLVSCSFFSFATLYSYCLLPEGSLYHSVVLVLHNSLFITLYLSSLKFDQNEI